MEDTALLVK